LSPGLQKGRAASHASFSSQKKLFPFEAALDGYQLDSDNLNTFASWDSLPNPPHLLSIALEITMPDSRPQSMIPAFIRHPFLQTFTIFYVLFQNAINWVFAPGPPPSGPIVNNLPKKRVAVIGTGLTGVSSAAHCIGHGFDVQLFEARPKDKGLGGIWSVSSSITTAVRIHY
jgi:NADPH-dependent 2,4-dienoyl-CoA reductase/sulfur reductase-like enzyme